MKLVSKATIDRFNDQDYSMQSVMEVVGRHPEHIPSFVRLKDQFDFGLLAITEMLGNVFEEDMKGEKFREIMGYSFTWDIETSQIPTIRLSRANTNDGTSGTFKIYTNSRYFAKSDVAALENTQQIYFTSSARRISDYEFEYDVVAWGQGDLALETEYTDLNSTLRYVYNAHPEYSERGSNKYEYNMERHINYMTKIRAGQAYSSDLKALEEKYFVSDANYAKMQKGIKPSNFSIYRFNSIEEQVLKHFMRSCNGALLFGRSNMDEKTGRPLFQTELNEDIISGDGLIAQYERYAYPIQYNDLSVYNFQKAINHIREVRGQSTGNHITVLCNREFSNQKAIAFQDAIGLFAPQNDGTWFFTKNDNVLKGMTDKYGGMKRYKETKVPNSVSIGATFNTYTYEGNTITFVIDEALTKHYPDRGYGIFIDTGIYEENGKETAAVELVTMKGRKMIEGTVTGMGGANGTTSGQVATALDASRYEILGWRGLRVKAPYSAVIMEENV